MGNCLAPKSDKRKFVNSKATLKQLKQQYNIDMKLLGKGSYGKVFKACKRADESSKVAIKVITKSEMDDEEIESLWREV